MVDGALDVLLGTLKGLRSSGVAWWWVVYNWIFGLIMGGVFR